MSEAFDALAKAHAAEVADMQSDIEQLQRTNAELLALLKENFEPRTAEQCCTWMDRAKTAIAKAEGMAP